MPSFVYTTPINIFYTIQRNLYIRIACLDIFHINLSLNLKQTANRFSRKFVVWKEDNLVKKKVCF